MTTAIRMCRDWADEHDRPVYTMGDSCPACAGPTRQSAPAPFNPRDPHGEYRRALIRSQTE